MLPQKIIKIKQQCRHKFNNAHYHDVIKQLLKIKKQASNDAELMYLLGCSFASLMQWADAIKSFEKCINLAPNVAQSHYAYAGALIATGMQDQAISSLKYALSCDNNLLDAHIALASLLININEIDDAREHINQVLKSNPDMCDAYTVLGRIEQEAGQHGKALPFLEKAVQLNNRNTHALCALATTLTNFSRKQEAKILYKKAIKIDRNCIEATASLSYLYALGGDYEKAEKLISPALEKNIYHPTLGIAFAQICQRTNNCDEAVVYIDKLLQSGNLAMPIIKGLNFSAGRLLDKLSYYDKAFDHYKAGNEVMKKIYDSVSHKKYITNLIEVFTPGFYMRNSGYYSSDNTPIFIVGMPRSGTSLVEQILAAHSDIHAAGELTYLDKIVTACGSETQSGVPFPLWLKSIGKPQFLKMATEYLTKTSELSKNAKRVTDKMPHNFYLLGLIQLIFPGARIIHCVRSPMDTCLSIYFQDFLEAHKYAKDLFNIGTHYNQYQYLMDYWKKILSIPILDISYEDLVNNQEETTKKLLEFCGLEWQEECLYFHRVSRTIDTASVHQVRQPLYKKSIERWRHYEKYLDDLKQGLTREF